MSAGLLVVVFLAALIGEPSSAQNLAPTFIYVIFWLGIVPVQVLLGNVWPVLNPWRAIANGVEWIWRKLGQDWTPPLEYPERLGLWPARVLPPLLRRARALLRGAGEPAGAGARDRALQLRDVVRDGGVRAAGRGTSTGTGSPSTSACSRGSRRSACARAGSCGGAVLRPVGPRDDGRGARVRRGDARLGRLRRPGPRTVLAGPPRPCRGAVHPRPAGPRRALRNGALAGRPDRLRARSRARIPRRGVAGASGLSGSDRSLVPEFVQSLVPIALVYAVAHYFSLLVIQGQYALPLASDPFGYGWDLFGTVDYAPNIAPFSPNTVWYVQVGCARRRPRRGAGGRARPRGHDPARARRPPLPVRHAGADGRLHRRWVVAPFAWLVAHGGTGGAIAEALLVVTIAAIFFAVWLRERRAGRSDSDEP